MSGEEEFNIPMEILQMMLVTKIYIRVEYATDNDFPVIPDGAVEAVVNNILKKLNDEQMSKGGPILNHLPNDVVVDKFMNELANLLHTFEKSKDTHNTEAKREICVPEFDKLTESTDESVDTYFALRYRDLESEGEEIFKPAATLKHTPTVVDFCYLFRNLGSSSPMYQKSSKLQEKKTELPTTETDEQKSSKTKKWGFKKFFAPLVSWMKPKPKNADQ